MTWSNWMVVGQQCWEVEQIPPAPIDFAIILFFNWLSVCRTLLFTNWQITFLYYRYDHACKSWLLCYLRCSEDLEKQYFFLNPLVISLQSEIIGGLKWFQSMHHHKSQLWMIILIYRTQPWKWRWCILTSLNNSTALCRWLGMGVSIDENKLQVTLTSQHTHN